MYKINQEFIDKRIAEKGLKKQYIAKELGMTAQTFSNKKSGKSDWTLTEVGKLVNVLDCDFSELFGG